MYTYIRVYTYIYIYIYTYKHTYQYYYYSICHVLSYYIILDCSIQYCAARCRAFPVRSSTVSRHMFICCVSFAWTKKHGFSLWCLDVSAACLLLIIRANDCFFYVGVYVYVHLHMHITLLMPSLYLSTEHRDPLINLHVWYIFLSLSLSLYLDIYIYI